MSVSACCVRAVDGSDTGTCLGIFLPGESKNAFTRGIRTRGVGGGAARGIGGGGMGRSILVSGGHRNSDRRGGNRTCTGRREPGDKIEPGRRANRKGKLARRRTSSYSLHAVRSSDFVSCVPETRAITNPIHKIIKYPHISNEKIELNTFCKIFDNALNTNLIASTRNCFHSTQGVQLLVSTVRFHIASGQRYVRIAERSSQILLLYFPFQPCRWLSRN